MNQPYQLTQQNSRKPTKYRRKLIFSKLKSKGILLDRELTINFDRMYDIIHLHELRQMKKGQLNDNLKNLPDYHTVLFQQKQADIPSQIVCQICLQNKDKIEPPRMEQDSFLSMIQQVIKADQLRHTIRESQQTIYYTCIQQQIEQNPNIMLEETQNENRNVICQPEGTMNDSGYI